MIRTSRFNLDASRAGAVVRAAAFFCIVQWLATPIIARPVLHAVGRRFEYMTDFTNHMFSAPRVLIQDSLVIALGLIVASLLISTERRLPGLSLSAMVMRRTGLSDGRPWAGRDASGCIFASILLSPVIGALALAGLMRTSLQPLGFVASTEQQIVLIPTLSAPGLAEEFVVRAVCFARAQTVSTSGQPCS